MLSVANVRSAGGAANYFASDNYYTKADADRSGQWIGKGAERLGLEGQIDAQAFEALLQGALPDGTRIGNGGQQHRPGTDLTFSLPKSWSLLSHVGGDKRIIDAYRSAVIETLGWAEKEAAQARIAKGAKTRTVITGNLTVGLFQHDTNRNQEPNVHFHAVVANLTQTPDGKWRALHNDKLWTLNTLLNSMTMARFRLEVEKLGYEIGYEGKHGNFEAKGISRESVMAFSTRRQEVLDARRGPGLEAGLIATLATRSPKQEIEDRDKLAKNWRETARSLDIDLQSMVRDAKERIANLPGESDIKISLIERGRQWLRAFANRLKSPPDDPLVPRHILRKSREEVAAAQATASAVRHLAQREATFSLHDILKTALDFGLPTAAPLIEKRIRALLRTGELVRGQGKDKSHVTTRDAIKIEERIIGEMAKGRGKAPSLMPSNLAGERLQAVANFNEGMILNKGQEAAGRLVISSSNRILAVQGIAGAGKSSLLKPLARLLREEGKSVLGLAVQNTLVQMLEKDTGISSHTLARFIQSHKNLLADKPNKKLLAKARQDLKNHVLVLDEASMVSNTDKDKLVRLANLLEVDRLVMIGDKKQLGAVDAGKPFALVQKAGIDTAKMITNLRARDKNLRRAQYAAQGGDISDAMSYLKNDIIEVKEDGAIVAAERWLSLTPEERSATSIYASGRKLRAAVNGAVQTGLMANGELGGSGIPLATLSRVNATREELRYPGIYKPAMMLELKAADKHSKLPKGRYEVISVDAGNKQVFLKDRRGKERRFQTSMLRVNADDNRIALYEQKPLKIYKNDRIRWTDSDHKRGLFNADQAEIVDIDKKHVTVRASSGMEHKLSHNDPMLRRIDLAYALNAHMAQGLTSDRGIAVMNSRERNLSNKQTFLVTITRLRDHLTLIVDDRDKLEAAVERNEGLKTSALEVTNRLRKAAAAGTGKGRDKLQNAEPKDLPELVKDRVKPYEIGI